MCRRIGLLSVLVALTVFLPRAAMAQEGTPVPETVAPARTDMRYVLPFGPDGLNAALTVTTKVGGSCTSDSLAAPDRPDVWDCIGQDNQIYDPCFEDPYAAPDKPAELACMTTPFSKEAVLLTLDEPLQREKEAPAAQGPYTAWDLPWALELANGDRCLLLQSDETVLAGETVYYDCADDGTILGAVDRGRPVWVVSYLANDAVSSGLVDVTVAWS